MFSSLLTTPIGSDRHRANAEIAGNDTLRRMLSHAFERIFLKRRTDSIYDPARGTLAHQEHLRLLDAMERRDTVEAIAVMHRHIQAGKKNVMADLRQRHSIRELRPMDFMNVNDNNH